MSCETMSCETVVGSIVALLDGELPDGERRAVEEHLTACASCQGEMRALRQARVLVTRRLRSVDVGVARGSFDELWARIDAAGEGGAPSGPAAHGRRADRSRAAGLRRPAVWAGAGGLALAASLALVIVGLPRDHAEEPGPAPTRVARKAALVDAPAAAARVTAKPEARLASAPKPAPVAKPDAARVPTDTSEDEVGLDAVADESVAVAVNEIDPPRELLERPDLFLNYPIVRKLDELQHLEAVLAESPDRGGAG